MLQRDHGATIDELIDATDWLAHTTRAALTGLRKRGYAVVIDRSDRGSFYRIVADLTVGDRASVARPVEERANSAAARKEVRLRGHQAVFVADVGETVCDQDAVRRVADADLRALRL